MKELEQLGMLELLELEPEVFLDALVGAEMAGYLYRPDHTCEKQDLIQRFDSIRGKKNKS